MKSTNLVIALTKGRILKETLPLLAAANIEPVEDCLLYTSPSPRDVEEARMPSSA